jgi:hypothetical protein
VSSLPKAPHPTRVCGRRRLRCHSKPGPRGIHVSQRAGNRDEGGMTPSPPNARSVHRSLEVHQCENHHVRL